MVINKYLAEFMGTFILVFVGSMGILSVGGANGPAEIIGIALAFGLGLMAAIWTVAHVSGAHFNPAVTLAMLMDKRMAFGDAIGYWVSQFAGAAVASLLILAASSQEAVQMTVTSFPEGTRNRAILIEVTLSALFVWMILAVTKTGGRNAAAAIALTLVAIHVAAIPFTGASVNPARSFGPAAVSTSFGNLWVYILSPLVGAVIAFGLYRLFPAADE